MKSTLKREEKKVESKFPCLKEWNMEEQSRFVVLFTNETEGTVVNAGNSNYKLGEYFTAWVEASEKDWIDYSGQIILEN